MLRALRVRHTLCILCVDYTMIGYVAYSSLLATLYQHLPRYSFFHSLTSDRRFQRYSVTHRAALQTAQIVLGQDSPEWGSSNIMPPPTGDISLYRGRLKTETANFIKTSRCKMTPKLRDLTFLVQIIQPYVASSAANNNACAD